MLHNEQDLIAGTVFATFSQCRNLFLGRQHDVGTKEQPEPWLCCGIHSLPRALGWAVITCAVLLNFSKVSLYPY